MHPSGCKSAVVAPELTYAAALGGETVGGKRADKTDIAVGSRIRKYRKAAGLSQTQLADQIGVTFQQVQKYENGKNRVGSGRLMHIARALELPITAFFDGLTKPIHKRQPTTERVAELRNIPSAPTLLAAFRQISDPVLEVEIINLARALGAAKDRR
jgi:transcriptional regulator with XRE-family HTH domain